MVNLFQYCTYIFEDLIPILVMLWMHHRNFRVTERVPTASDDDPNFDFLTQEGDHYLVTESDEESDPESEQPVHGSNSILQIEIEPINEHEFSYERNPSPRRASMQVVDDAKQSSLV